MQEKCRGCGKAITYAYREWWDESDDNACEEIGNHMPFVRTQLAPTPVVQTMGPVAKWRRNGQARILPHYGNAAKPRKLTF